MGKYSLLQCCLTTLSFYIQVHGMQYYMDRSSTDFLPPSGTADISHPVVSSLNAYNTYNPHPNSFQEALQTTSKRNHKKRGPAQMLAIAPCAFKHSDCKRAHPYESIYYLEICFGCYNDYYDFLQEITQIKQASKNLREAIDAEAAFSILKLLSAVPQKIKECCKCNHKGCTKETTNYIPKHAALNAIHFAATPLCLTCLEAFQCYLGGAKVSDEQDNQQSLPKQSPLASKSFYR